MEKYPKNSKTARDLQNNLFIIKCSLFQRIIMHFKKCSLNRKMIGKLKNVREFHKLFHQFPIKYPSILEMFANSRILFKRMFRI